MLVTPLDAQDSELKPLVLLDGDFIDLIALYERISGEDIVADLSYSYPVHFNAQDGLTDAQMLEALRLLMRVQGVGIRESSNGKLLLERVSDGWSADGPVDSFEVRLGALMSEISRNRVLGYIELKNESVPSALDLFAQLAGKPLVLGLGVEASRPINLKETGLTVEGALRQLDALLIERGVIVTDRGNGLLLALACRERDLTDRRISGMSRSSRRRVVPGVRQIEIPKN